MQNRVTRRFNALPFLMSAAAVALAGCHVWRDYGGTTINDGDGEPCWAGCEPEPWWDDDYSFRAPVRADAEVQSDEPIVLPVLVDESVVPADALREDSDDLRVTVNGAELPRAVSRVENGRVLWVRFERAPTESDAIYLYWANPDAPIPPHPWAGYELAVHFDEEFDNTVPDSGKVHPINEPSIIPEGRLGSGALVSSWPGSLRMYDGDFLGSGGLSIAFSFRGRRSENDDRSFLQIPDPCQVVDVSRTDTRETAVAWTDPVTCTGEDDPFTAVSVPINVMDGAWHDGVVSLDLEAGSMAITVDDEHASTEITGGERVMSRFDIRGGSSDDAPGEFQFDEVRVWDRPTSEVEARLLIGAVRGEVFEVGATEER